MITINNLEGMKPYYNAETNTYVFDDDVYFKFDLAIQADISVTHNIYGGNINARNINAYDIDARNINAWNIHADDIRACNIDAHNIKANDIHAWNINADDIKAYVIDAKDISFYAVCFATQIFVCNSITGRRTNAKYFCLDNEVVIKGETI